MREHLLDKDKPICGECEWTAAWQWWPGFYFHNIMISFVQIQTSRSHYIKPAQSLTSSNFGSQCSVASWKDVVIQSFQTVTPRDPSNRWSHSRGPHWSSHNYTYNLWSKKKAVLHYGKPSQVTYVTIVPWEWERDTASSFEGRFGNASSVTGYLKHD